MTKAERLAAKQAAHEALKLACAHCGRQVYRLQKKQRFCSSLCRQKAWFAATYTKRDGKSAP